MSFKPEVTTDDTGKWYGNGLRFATHEEAWLAVNDLSMRWLAVREIRVSESEDPVNYRWERGAGLVHVNPLATSAAVQS